MPFLKGIALFDKIILSEALERHSLGRLRFLHLFKNSFLFWNKPTLWLKTYKSAQYCCHYFLLFTSSRMLKIDGSFGQCFWSHLNTLWQWCRSYTTMQLKLPLEYRHCNCGYRSICAWQSKIDPQIDGCFYVGSSWRGQSAVSVQIVNAKISIWSLGLMGMSKKNPFWSSNLLKSMRCW